MRLVAVCQAIRACGRHTQHATRDVAPTERRASFGDERVIERIEPGGRQRVAEAQHAMTERTRGGGGRCKPARRIGTRTV